MADEPDKIGPGADHAATAAAPEMASNRSMETEAIELNDTAAQAHGMRRSRWNRRIALIGGLIALVAAAVVLPPLINVGRYQRQIAAVMARSLGRPVHMSGVELRLLPRPGFVLHDLAVGEDPRFGAEPILSARTVIASIRITSLWRGRLEVDRVSVDEASLNLVRSAQGRWNLDSLLIGTGGEGNGMNSGGLIRSTSAHFPYLEATDSQVNLKNGVEKSPYSLAHTDLSLWQDEPGQWRVRLRGQPVRTDIEMSAADTGEVRMEATLHSAAQLRDMPLRLQMEWRDAQLGQLSRLMLGSDEGWRGAVTADIDVQGTPENAQTKARLQATGVRREEFAPETPLDFDANCAFRYQHSQNAVHGLGCDTAIGGGRLHLTAELPGVAGGSEATLEATQLPLQAGLDLLRTVRGGFAPGISVKGTANGSLVYREADLAKPAAGAKTPPRSGSLKAGRKGADSAALPVNLKGSLIVDGVQLKGGGLKEPLSLPRMTWTPALVPNFGMGQASSTGLATRFTVALAASPAAAPAPVSAAAPAAVQSKPDGGTAPEAGAPPAPGPVATGQNTRGPVTGTVPVSAQTLSVQLGIDAQGYSAAVSGSAGIVRLRDLAYAFGLPHLEAADGFSGAPAELDLSAQEPWIDSGEIAAVSQPAQAQPSAGPAIPGKKSGSGGKATVEHAPGEPFVSASLTMRRAQWKAAYLAQPVHLAQATATISAARITFASDFSYGGSSYGGSEDTGKPAGKDAGKDANSESAKNSPGVRIDGSVVLNAYPNCKSGALAGGALPAGPQAGCEPQIQIRLGALDAATAEAALIGTPQQKGIFAPLMDRMRSSDQPKWPEAAVNVQADSLAIGSATLQKPVLQLRFKTSQIEIENWQADVLGGSAKGTGSFAWTDGKPSYAFDGSWNKVSATTLGALLNAQWSGGPVSGSGSVQLSGLLAKDLAASAAGDLHFDWLHGALLMPPAGLTAPAGSTASADSAVPESSTAPATAEADRPQETKQVTKFDDWSGAVKIQGGKAQIGENAMLSAKRSSNMTGSIIFGSPVKLTIAPVESKVAAHAAKSAAPPAVK